MTRRAVAPVGRVDFLPAKLRDSVASQAARMAADGRSGDAAALTTPSLVSADGLTAPSLVSADGQPAPDDATTKTLPPRDPRLHSLGLIPAPPSKPARAQEILQEIQSARAAQAAQARVEGQPAPAPQHSPPSHDNSAGLPPVGDQGAQGSCVSWATGYYVKSYQEKKERGWSLTDPAHQFSPAFLYNQLQNYDEGSTFQDNLDLLCDQGCASLAAMPYSDTDYRTWPGAAAYREGIPYRLLSYDYLGNGEAESVFDSIKAIVSSGDVCAVGLPIFRPGPYSPGAFDLVSAADPNYDLPPAGDIYLAGYHALAIVGYDESKFGGTGGYKIVNSWGTGWGDGGFAWISEPFLTTYGFDFHRLTDRIGYAPTSFVHFKVSHPWWGGDYWVPEYDDVAVVVGVGPANSPVWSKVLLHDIPRIGETVDMWADLTEAATWLPPDWTNRWWLRIEDHYREYVGTLSICEIETNATSHTAAVVLPLNGPYFDGDLYVYIPAGEAASANYYVNDDSVAGDSYCSAPGNDANDGLTPATPKRTIQAVIDRYTLRPGDTVWVDAGQYAPFNLTQLDKGVLGSPVKIVGSLGANGEAQSIFQGSSTPITLGAGAEFASIENFRVIGGANGVNLDGSWDSGNEGVTFRRLHVSGVSSYGMNFYEASGVTLDHCIIESFGVSPGVYARFSSVEMNHCVIVGAAGQTCTGAYSNGSSYTSLSNLTLHHSILWNQNGYCFYLGNYGSITASDYNDLYATGTGKIGYRLWGNMTFSTLADWQAFSSRAYDQHSQSADPLFANPAQHDFHLRSTAGRWDPAASGGIGQWVADTTSSLCIDFGDLSADWSQEPAPNGGRVNIGAYGGTPWASKSSVTRRYLFMDKPETGKTYSYTCPIAWRQYGDGWQTGDTLRAEFSADGGQNWQAVSGASALPYGALSHAWDILGVSPGTSYTLRLVSNQDSATSAAMTGVFSIRQPISYYVNDAVATNDVYCSATGNDANNGLTPAMPKATVQAILKAYDLEPGDVVYIDTGTYLLASDILTTAAHSGDASYPVRFVGSTHPDGTLMDRNSIGSGYGFYLNGADYVSLENLRVTRARYGIYLYNGADGCRISNCRLYGNGRYGAYIFSSNNAQIDHCLVDRNANSGIVFYYSQDSSVQNCTVVQNGGAQVSIEYYSNNLTLRNNILWADGTGRTCIGRSYVGALTEDYSDLYVTNGGAAGIAPGAHDLNLDPLFVDPDGPDNIAGNADDDFHLQSTAGSWHGGAWTPDALDSPCIDAGDPATDIGAESAPNGGRINLGAYGGTAQASKTPAGRVLTVASPNGGELWRGTQTIRWLAVGGGWTTGDTVRLEHSADGGGTWAAITGASALDWVAGGYAWDTTSVASGPIHKVRAVCNEDEATSDTSDANFTIHNTGLSYYVNDASTANDVYCTAAGNDANGGLTPATPKATVQAILAAYDLEGGDTIYIDTGTYVLTANIEIGAQDGGEASNPVRFVGSTHPDGTLVDRNNIGSGYGFYLNGADYVSLENLRVTRAYYGIYLYNGADGCRVSKCRLYGNGTYGLYAYSNGAQIDHCLVDRNANTGIMLLYSDNSSVLNCTVALNTLRQVYINSSTDNLTRRNNIFCADGSGKASLDRGYVGTLTEDYNDLWATNSATPGIPLGAHDLNHDPRFVDPDGPDNIAGNADDDFHLQSTAGSWHGGAWTADPANSPCIDAGDPTDTVGNEPAPNGARVNLGAYGGTVQASETPAGRVLTMVSPNGGEVWRGTQTIRWLAIGGGWTTGDTIRLEHSADSGGTWTGIAGASALAHAAGSHSWDTTAVISGAAHRIRAVCNEDEATSDTSDANFTIHNTGLSYYVNDASTANDVYCVAAGNDANDGLTSATPKATVQAILSAYDLEGGDVVFVDTGTYSLDADIVIGAMDSGAAGESVTIQGSSLGTTLTRTGSVGTRNVIASSASYIVLRNLICTNGTNGVYITGQYNTLEGMTLRGNSQTGLELYTNSAGTAVRHTLFDGNGSSGIYQSGSNNGCEVVNCTFVNQPYGIYAYYAYSLKVSNSVFDINGASRYGIYMAQVPQNLTASDYNDFYTSNGGQVGFYSGARMTLADWRTASGKDTHSLSVNPLFVNAAAGDYHLQSTVGSWHGGAWTADALDSPCIDAGDPSSPVGEEPTPNGNRTNLGAYGATTQASLSTTPAQIALCSPNGGEFWRSQGTLRWRPWGNGWTSTHTVSLSYSTDAGAHWSAISGAAGLPAQEGEYVWNLIGLPRGNQYKVRVTSVEMPALADDSDSTFTIGGVFYVNDAFTTHDVYCSAPGDDANDGLSGATPKATIQVLLNAYDLAPGDMVFVDTGVYPLGADITIAASDGGDSNNHVRLIGSSDPDGSVLDRQVAGGASGSCVYLTASYFDVENFVMRNAQYGVNVPGVVHRWGHRILNNHMPGCAIAGTITHDGEIKGNVCKSISLAAGSANSAGPWIIEHNTVYGGGISLTGPSNYNNTIRHNIIYATGGYCLYIYNPTATTVCDYNDLFTTGSAKAGRYYVYDAATLNEWRSLSGNDLHSLSLDSLFANPAGGDYHLKSTEGRWDPAANGGVGGWVSDAVNSPCIDAGDPTDSVGFEPMPNGGRINIGTYGGTAEASKSPVSGRWLVFDGAGDSEPLHAWEPLRWSARGANWALGETVRLEISDDSGGAWQPIGGADSLAYDAAQHWWDSRSVPDGDYYRFRVVVNAGAPTSGTAERDCAIHNLQAPWGPNPSDGATGVPINTDLGWNSAAGAAFYDVYFWKSSQTKPATPLTSVTTTLCDPPQSLAFGTAYKWQVVARNGAGQTPGPEWTFTTIAAPAALHVSSATGSDADGDASQGNPLQTIGLALSVVTGSATTTYSICVAEGVYRETVTMNAYEHLYGGYRAGDWTRDPAQWETIIDGEGARRCVVASNNATLDGFTLRNGYAADGGGIYGAWVSPTIRNCQVKDCRATRWGGGLYLYFGATGGAECSITKCSITSCTATTGGGLYLDNGLPTVAECSITSCTATTGGGISTSYSSPQIVNCLITGCSASAGGGAINIFGYSPQIVNCTIHGNQSGIQKTLPSGAGIKNTILWNNGDDLLGYVASSVSYCDIEDGDFAGQNGNISTDPLFQDAGNGDFRLALSSPCVDTATSQGAPTVDLNGLARPQGAGFDMGCYEFLPTGSLQVIISPQGAIDAGAQWRRAGTTTWLASGATESEILVGSHEVEFKTVTGWSAPASAPVTISNGETTTLSDPAATYTRHTGTVTVNVTPAEAGWSFTDGDGAAHNGTGNLSLPGIPTGTITMTWGDLANFDSPSPNPVSLSLGNGETTTFTGEYARQTGTVQVTVTPSGASWSFADGDGGMHTGTGDATVTGIPTGSITLTWMALTGFTAPTPNPESKSLALSGTASFSGTYTPYVGPTGTVVVAVTPDTASWTFTDANSGIHIGTGDASLPGVPAGDVVLTWSALADHDEPVPSIVTQALTPNGSTTFTGAYARHKGTVQVSVTPDSASWSFTDGDRGAHNGTGDASVADIPTGTITLTWNALTGYRMPSVNPEAKAIGKGGTVTFVGTYSSAPARAGDWMLYE